MQPLRLTTLDLALDTPVPRRAFLRIAGLATAGAWLAAASGRAATTPAFDWKVLTINERDYISLKDVATFYRFSRLERDGRHIWLRSPALQMKASVDSDELYLNNVKFCLSYPVLERDGLTLLSRLDLAKLLDPVIRPAYINNPIVFDTVILDAGHGGQDSGTKGLLKVWEKEYTLDSVTRLSRLLTAAGLKVKFTRSDDTFIPKTERPSLANKTEKCIFVSWHYNSGASSATGVETYALSPSGTASTDQRNLLSDAAINLGNTRDAENIALATAVHAMVLFKVKCIDRGIRRARWTVLTGLERAGILFEGGFISNPEECAKINTPEYRDLLATSMCGGILNYRRALMKRIVTK